MFSISDIKNEVYSAVYQRGRILYESGAVTDFSYDIYMENASPKADISAKVRGNERDFYQVNLVVDEKFSEVSTSGCDCDAYFNYDGLCKHCAAVLLAYVNKRQAVDILRIQNTACSHTADDNSAVDNTVLNAAMHTSSEFKSIMNRHSMKAGSSYLLPENVYGKIELEPILKVQYHNASVEFKIGAEQKYVLKNISSFLRALQENERIHYGKKLDFYHNRAAFTEQSLPLLDFIIRQDADKKRQSRYHSWYVHNGRSFERYMELDEIGIDRFFEAVGTTSFMAEISYQNMELFYVSQKEYKPALTIKTGGLGIFLILEELTVIRGYHHYYFCRDGIIYRSTNKLAREACDVFDYLMRQTERSCYIAQEELPIFCRDLLPLLKETFRIDSGSFDETLYVPKKPEFELYLDKMDLHVTGAKLLAVYEDKKYNVLNDIKPEEGRNISEEMRVRNLVLPYFNEIGPDKSIFLITRDEDKLYQLISGGLRRLSEFMTIYSSESFRTMKVLPAPKVSVGVSLKSNLLELQIQSDEMPPEQLAYLLTKYNQRKKYIRLKNGDFLSLGDNGLKQLAEASQDLQLTEANLKKGKIHIPKYRAMYLDTVLESSKLLTVEKNRTFKGMIRDMKTIEDSDFEVPSILKPILRPYQTTGFLWLKTLRENGFGGILADDMGLGKTLQVISILLCEYQEITAGIKPRQRSLIVCPASLVYNWQREIERFAPGLPAVIIAGTAAERKQKITDSNDASVLITSYDLLKRDTEYYQDIIFTIEVIDEAQYIKNPGTQASKGVKQISAAFRLALTGTPIENRLSELWSIFDFLMPGFLYTYQRFKQEIETPIIADSDQNRMERLQRMIRPFILRRVKKDVLTDLPEKLEETLYAKMETEQLLLYDAHVQQIKHLLSDKTEKEFRKQKIQILAELTKLRQICCDPALLYEDYNGGCAKTEMCVELIQNAINGGHKILLFSQFTTMLTRLAKQLEKEHISYYMLTGAVSKEKRIEMVENFNKDDVSVFCISLKAGGTGLNLTAADIVIHYDPWWNIAVQNQATDRAHRIGQEHIVTVYKLVSEGTIEEKIIQIQERKKALAEQILEGEGMNQASFSKEEIIALLS